jgi:hypothetical protein
VPSVRTRLPDLIVAQKVRDKPDSRAIAAIEAST